MKSDTSLGSVGSLGTDEETSISDGSSPIDLIELKILTASLEDRDEEEGAETEPTKAPPTRQLSSLACDAVYGNPLSEEDAAAVVPPGDDGVIRYSIVIPDVFCENGRLTVGGLNKRDFDLAKGTIKPRRASLTLTQSQLLSSLTKTDGPNGPRYIFNGILNGWPSLRNFELVALEKKRSLGPLTPPDYLNNVRHAWSPSWSAEKDGGAGISPKLEDKKIYRAKLRGAPWTSIGWAPESPGFLFWYEARRPDDPRVLYGTNTIENVGDDRCKTVHMISHRYAMQKETPRDKVTYHSIVFLEWEHGQYGTIVEGAYLNGIGGYRGRSNWYDDKDEPVTELYMAMPPELISPWLTTAAELRAFDVEAKTLDEMKEFIEKYTGPEKRFVDPQYTFSHPARLTNRSRSDLAQYLINYISRDCSYSQLTRNCQTLAADLCSFLAGKKDVVPYHPINRIDYRNRNHFFLYDSDMFIAKKTAHLKGKIAR